MSWMNMLYQTYENNIAMAGKTGEAVTLSVIAHYVANAQLEITVNAEGEFLNAAEVSKEDSKTLIPVTESSQGRSSGIAPHALCDTLSYIAGDFSEYLAEEKEKQKCINKFGQYLQGVQKWRDSGYGHRKVQAICSYLEQKCVIQDLMRCGLIQCDENGCLTKNKIAGQPYEKVLVRFIVVTGENGISNRTWQDETLIESYTKYYLSSQEGERDTCFITGENQVIANNHPKGILQANYGAKLISANDSINFTYRGRFHSANEACTVSYEASQKVHNALSWLAAKQGVTVGTQDKRTYICWNPKGKPVPKLDGEFDFLDEEEPAAYTQEEYKIRLHRAIQGSAKELQDNDDIVVMGLDAATTGRLSITYYNELKASDFLKRLELWSNTCCWTYTHFEQGKKPVDEIRTPTPKQIVTYAFGVEHAAFIEVSDKVLKEQIQRIYDCILDAMPLPWDMVHAIVLKASNPLAYKNHGNHKRVLATACALIRKYAYDRSPGEAGEGENVMELNTENHDRSYLFGRFLAVAELMEKAAAGRDANRGGNAGHESYRMTNAERLWGAFVNRPFATSAVLVKALNPYLTKLPSKGSAEFYKGLFLDIMDSFEEKDEDILNKGLEETYLLGYTAQKKTIYKGKQAPVNDEEEKRV